MNFGVYCLFDKKLKRANLPFYARGDQEAVVIVLRSQPPRVLYEDLELRRLANFNDETCSFEDSSAIVALPPLPKEGDQNV